jgi:uncharacterized protein
MEEHPNAATVRQGFAAFATGDIDGVRHLLADDIVWTTLGNNPVAGVYRGKAELIGFFGRIVMETEGTLEIELHDVIADDKRAVALLRTVAERNGKKLDSSALQVYEFNHLGKVVAQTGPYSDDTAAIDAFWSD